MAKVKVKIKSAGARAILNSGEVQAALKEYADGARDSANASLGADGYESYVQPGRNRARAVVHTTDWESRKHNADTNALLKGL
ncbi:MAG TPA: hypothetical protein PKE46_02410 [Micropruina sp.]|nr:hypothetical protein [Micropruina sp.]HMR20966.1 hypothetical protein [Micropruina sp.]